MWPSVLALTTASVCLPKVAFMKTNNGDFNTLLKLPVILWGIYDPEIAFTAYLWLLTSCPSYYTGGI